MTSPEPTATGVLQIPVSAHPNALHAGLRQHWVEATDGPEDPDTGQPAVTAALAAGAGLGSKYLVLQVERPGLPTIFETSDVTAWLGDWIEAAIARADAPALAVHGDHVALPYDGANAELAHRCQICGVPVDQEVQA